MSKKPKERRISISFTERELYLLENGFGTSYTPDPDDADNVELAKITAKLNRAMAR